MGCSFGPSDAIRKGPPRGIHNSPEIRERRASPFSLTQAALIGASAISIIAIIGALLLIIRTSDQPNDNTAATGAATAVLLLACTTALLAIQTYFFIRYTREQRSYHSFTAWWQAAMLADRLGPLDSPDETTIREWREQAQLNLRLMFLATQWRTREISEAHLRLALQDLVHMPAMRTWARVRDAFYEGFSTDEIGRRLIEILDEEHKNAGDRTQTS